MLASLSPRVNQQILLRSCCAATAVGSFQQQQLLLQCAPSLLRVGSNADQQQQRCHSTRASYYGKQSQYHLRRQQQKQQLQHQQQPRRPYRVGGKAVAFHVKDFTDPLFQPKSLNSNKTQNRSLNHAAVALEEVEYEEDDYYTATASTSSTASNNSNVSNKPERQYDSDMIVVLDMDECLIHSQFLTNNPGAKFYAHQVARSASNKTNTSRGHDDEDDSSLKQKVETFRFHLPDSGDLVQVNQRPHLETFLEEVTSKYETHIYTAAMKLYAEPILNKLDPKGDRFAKRWYPETCDFDKTMGAYVKNLDNLEFNINNDDDKTNNANGTTYEEYLASQADKDALQAEIEEGNPLRRVVLVDNNPLSFLTHPTNGILVSSFYNDATDKTLPAVLDLLKELDHLDDVRPTLDQRFGLRAALSEIQGNRRQQQQKKWVGNSMRNSQ